MNSNFIEYSYSNITCQNSGAVNGNDITISETGVYLIWASAKNNGTSDYGFTEISIVIDNTTYPLDTVTHNSHNIICNGTYMGKLQSGQILHHRVFQNGGYAETISDRRLRMIKLK